MGSLSDHFTRYAEAVLGLSLSLTSAGGTISDLDFHSPEIQLDIPEYILSAPGHYSDLFQRPVVNIDTFHDIPDYFENKFDRFHDIALLVDYYYLGEIDWRRFTLDLTWEVTGKNDEKYQQIIKQGYLHGLDENETRYEAYAPMISYVLYQAYYQQFEDGNQAGKAIKKSDVEFISQAINHLMDELDAPSKLRDRNEQDESLAQNLVASENQGFSIDSQGFDAKLIDEDIGVLKIKSFKQGKGEEMAAALRFMKSQGARHFIIDLRDNLGGKVQTTTYLADRILPEGTIMYEAFRYKDPVTVFSDESDILNGARLSVLINNNSASASEILASALRENDRATIIGERTAGKGTIQYFYDLPESDQQLKLTSAFSISPERFSFQKTGVLPDIYVGNWDPDDKNTRERKFSNPSGLSDYPLSPEFECHVDPMRAYSSGSLQSNSPDIRNDHTMVCAIEHMRRTSEISSFEPVSSP